MTGSSCASVSHLLLETSCFALDGVTIPVVDAGISVSILPLSGGRNPLHILKDGVRSESMDA